MQSQTYTCAVWERAALSPTWEHQSFTWTSLPIGAQEKQACVFRYTLSLDLSSFATNIVNNKSVNSLSFCLLNVFPDSLYKNPTWGYRGGEIGLLFQSRSAERKQHEWFHCKSFLQLLKVRNKLHCSPGLVWRTSISLNTNPVETFVILSKTCIHLWNATTLGLLSKQIILLGSSAFFTCFLFFVSQSHYRHINSASLRWL